MSPAERQVAMGLIFYPRAGSAQVARYLSGALEDAGWHGEKEQLQAALLRSMQRGS